MTYFVELRSRAQNLLQEIDCLSAHHRSLRQLVEATRVVEATHAAARAARLGLHANPELCDGLIELLRRTDPQTAQMIPSCYRTLLSSLHPAGAVGQWSTPVNYAELAPGARPYLLGPFLSLSISNAYPQLCLQRSDPGKGRLVYTVPTGPSDLKLWRQHLDSISGWLGGTWDIVDHTVSTVTLVRREQLPAVIHLDPAHMSIGQLYLGVDTSTRRHVYTPFAELTSGTMIVGATGTGKTNALGVILQSLFANLASFSAVYLVDGKDGVTFDRYRHVAPGKVHVLWEERDLWQLTTRLVEEMRTRNAAQRAAGVNNATSDFVAVVIDELPAYVAKPSVDAKHPDNKAHARFLDELAMLARRGRSTGLRLMISAQEPVVEQVPATVRANCLTTIAFKLPIDAHAVAVFGQLDGLPADPRALARGRALLKNGLTGEIQQVQFPVLTTR